MLASTDERAAPSASRPNYATRTRAVKKNLSTGAAGTHRSAGAARPRRTLGQLTGRPTPRPRACLPRSELR